MSIAVEMKTITPKQLHEWKIAGKKFQLIDIREEHEIAENSIGGEHIPMAEVLTRFSEIEKDIPVVIHCRSGKRSSAVVHSLEKKFSFENLYTLEGGIMAWIDVYGE